MTKINDAFGGIFRKMSDWLCGVCHFCCSAFKNVYPCELLSEKISTTSIGSSVISYKILGQEKVYETTVEKLFNNQRLLACFHPRDAFKLGCMAFGDIIECLPEDERMAKFEQIKQAMIHSGDDFQYQSYPNPRDNEVRVGGDEENVLWGIWTSNNKYPFKMVDGRADPQNGTIITYTIFTKRDGFEVPLQELVNDEAMLKKFHPTTAIKFGFIGCGDDEFIKK